MVLERHETGKMPKITKSVMAVLVQITHDETIKSLDCFNVLNIWSYKTVDKQQTKRR